MKRLKIFEETVRHYPFNPGETLLFMQDIADKPVEAEIRRILTSSSRYYSYNREEFISIGIGMI